MFKGQKKDCCFFVCVKSNVCEYLPFYVSLWNLSLCTIYSWDFREIVCAFFQMVWIKSGYHSLFHLHRTRIGVETFGRGPSILSIELFYMLSDLVRFEFQMKVHLQLNELTKYKNERWNATWMDEKRIGRRLSIMIVRYSWTTTTTMRTTKKNLFENSETRDSIHKTINNAENTQFPAGLMNNNNGIKC